jgi:hypothetical protein
MFNYPNIVIYRLLGLFTQAMVPQNVTLENEDPHVANFSQLNKSTPCLPSNNATFNTVSNSV